MKNLHVVILAITLLISSFVLSRHWQNAKLLDRSVTVKGLAEKEVKANVAVWPIDISFVNNNLKALNAEIEKQKQEVLSFYQKYEFADNEISIAVPIIRDNEALTYNNNSAFRFTAKLECTVRTDDIGKMKKAISNSQVLLEKGILISPKNQWQPVRYFYTKLNDIKPEMIEQATKKAKEVALKFAQDSDSKLGKIKSANQGQFSISDLDANTPEIKKVRVVTTVNYYLRD